MCLEHAVHGIVPGVPKENVPRPGGFWSLNMEPWNILGFYNDAQWLLWSFPSGLGPLDANGFPSQSGLMVLP